MPLIAKVLAEGQLPSSKTTLYTVPASTSAYVKCMKVTIVSGGATQTIQIYVKPGSTSRRYARLELYENQTADIIDKDDGLTLEAGDIIEGQSTNAATVDYVITGGEES